MRTRISATHAPRVGASLPAAALCTGLAAAAMLASLAAQPAKRAAPDLGSFIVCTGAPDPSRPASQVTVLQTRPLTGQPGKRMVTIRVRYPPGGYTPRHVHGGDLTVIVAKGTVRSQHAGLLPAEYHAGDAFHEPRGTTHVFIENPSATDWAEIVGVMVLDDGAALTTFLD